jgi:dienelactone hydrolase
MATVLLFHHALGRTAGVVGFADRLREAGHDVHVPDLFDGLTFPSLDEGVAHVEAIGFEEVIRRGEAAADALPPDVVYAGFSLGVMPAQALTQRRPGARAALLYHSCVPPDAFDTPWPAGVPVQLHFMADDPWAEEDLPAAEALAAQVPGAELFRYPGRGHVFADPTTADHDPTAAALLLARSLELLARID